MRNSLLALKGLTVPALAVAEANKIPEEFHSPILCPSASPSPNRSKIDRCVTVMPLGSRTLKANPRVDVIAVPPTVLPLKVSADRAWAGAEIARVPTRTAFTPPFQKICL